MRLYRLLLRLYPSSFRHEYGAELCRIFARRRRDASGPPAVAAFWLATIADVVFNAGRVHFDILRQDLRTTGRALRRAPGFAAAAILVTALGVGATTAAFTLTDHVLIRPLPFPDADRLVKLWEGAPQRPLNSRSLLGTNDVSPASYFDWKEMARSFSIMGAYGFTAANIVGHGEPERLDGVAISADALEAIGIAPAIGRRLTAADDTPGAACAILISDGFFRRRFGANVGILGQPIRLGDESCEVAGVMPRGFEFPSRTIAFWRPARFQDGQREDRGDNYLRVVARLQPGVSIDQAQAELAVVAATLRQTHPKDEIPTAAVIGLRDEVSGQSRTLLIAVVGAAACLLLIACTNLASLVIARATARGRELAVRTAMGAGRVRLVRQLLTESLVLASIGGGLGVLLAIGAIPTAARLVPTILPIADIPPVDVRMLLVAALVTAGTGLGFGVLPALRASRMASASGLRDSTRTGASRRTERTRAALVMAQVSISIALVVSSGLLIRALIRVQSTPTGFDSANVLSLQTPLPWEKYGPTTTRVEFYDRVLGEIRKLPGVTGAAYTSFLPMTMPGGVWPVAVPGRIPEPGRNDMAFSRYVTPEFFQVMRIPVITGREFDATDSPASQPVAIVSRDFVRNYLEDGPAIGRTFTFGPGGERTIIGVVGDVRVRGLERATGPQVYMPHTQQRDNQSLVYLPKDLVVRIDPGTPGAVSLDALVAPIRQIVRNADSQQPIAMVRPLDDIVEGETAARSVQVRVLGAFAALSCILAAVGLHGLLAFLVSARTREFGVRLALGAEPRQILTLVAWRGLVLGLAGIAVGVALAYGAGRWLESVLVGVRPTDPPTLAIAVGIAVTMTLAGSLMPAFRASRTDPRNALQAE
jgi:putative ABC transport system permease protein